MRVGLVTFAVAAVISSEVGFAQPVIGLKRSREHLKLAVATFPLTEQATFDEDLALLADVLAAKLESPLPLDSSGDHKGRELVPEILNLMEKWNCPKFRAPLEKHLKRADDNLLGCVLAIVAQRDSHLLEVAATRGNESGFMFDSGTIETVPVAEILKKGPHPESEFIALDTLLPPAREWSNHLQWQNGLTILGAAAQLHDEQRSIRLQAWVWLAELGIIAPTEDVLHCWPELTDEQQKHLLRMVPKFLGQQRLLALCEELSRDSSDAMRRRLLSKRARLGSESAKDEVRQIVQQALKSDDFVGQMATEDGTWALLAAEYFADESDIPWLIRLHRCHDRKLVLYALRALCAIDHPAAIEEIGEALLNPRLHDEDGYVLSLLRELAVRPLKHRRDYLNLVAIVLRHEKNAEFDRLSKLLGTFQVMSGEDFGFSGGTREDWDAFVDWCLRWNDGVAEWPPVLQVTREEESEVAEQPDLNSRQFRNALQLRRLSRIRK